jgi:hypothetical protein
MAEFRWLNKLGVESSAGFVVQFTGRFKAEYREGGRILVVRVENGRSGGKPAICYSPESFQAWAPNHEEQQRVEANFKEAMVFQGLVPVPD